MESIAMRYTGMHEHTTHMGEGGDREEGMKGGREESQDPPERTMDGH